ncbi:hypothetical protein MXB_4731 [Myxobolus squamalis]|nr:hypothetical protein MXB_4731 [Myxobolus squamalis]
MVDLVQIQKQQVYYRDLCQIFNFVTHQRRSRIPGTKMMYFGKTKNVDLLYKCIHTLMICLCSSIENQESTTDETTKRQKNVFVDLVESFHKKDDIDLIISSLNSLIKLSLRKNFWLNRNFTCDFHQECLVLLWRFCIFNQKFMSFLLISPFMTSIIFSFMIYLHDIKTDNCFTNFPLFQLKLGLSILSYLVSVHSVAIVLLNIQAIIMNSIYDGKTYFDLPKNCSYNDYLIYVKINLLIKSA